MEASYRSRFEPVDPFAGGFREIREWLNFQAAAGIAVGRLDRSGARNKRY